MARENRVRLSDAEKRSLENARKILYDEPAGVPFGVVVARCAKNAIEDEETGGVRY